MSKSVQSKPNPILTIDIGHPPMRGSDAEEALERALRQVELSNSLRILKIVHGYGSKGSSGSLKTLVQDWAYTRRKRIQTTIDGGDIDIFSADVQDLLKECSISFGDLGGGSEGVTLIWVK